MLCSTGSYERGQCGTAVSWHHWLRPATDTESVDHSDRHAHLPDTTSTAATAAAAAAAAGNGNILDLKKVFKVFFILVTF